MSSARKDGHTPRHEEDKEIKKLQEMTKNPSDENRNHKRISPENVNAKNDDSNPQQGSLSRMHQERSSNTVNEAPPSLMPHFESPPTASDRHSKHHAKITPFKRDNRKLFVGGLPPNGKYHPEFLVCLIKIVSVFTTVLRRNWTEASV